MAEEKFEFHDRYSATGTPRPDPKTVCLGMCEGMGFFPMTCLCRGTILGHRHDEDDDDLTGPPGEYSGSVWCWVNCADCGGTSEKRGTGKRPHRLQSNVVPKGKR